MEYGSCISAAAALLFLAAAAYEDYKTQRISLILVAAGAVIGILMMIVINEKTIMQILYGILTGNAILLIGYASREAIGYGDGLIFIITGIFLGWVNNVLLIISSLLLAAVCSMILMLLRIKKRNDRIAFAPFVLGAYVLMTVVSI